jgi:hypothetical protein
MVASSIFAFPFPESASGPLVHRLDSGNAMSPPILLRRAGSMCPSLSSPASHFACKSRALLCLMGKDTEDQRFNISSGQCYVRATYFEADYAVKA